MRKKLRQFSAALIASILAIFLLGASSNPLARLTIINKSGIEIAVKLNSIPKFNPTKPDKCETTFYYLPVPEGSKEVPSIKDFTILRDTYAMQVYYIETYDPVYGFKCIQPLPNSISVYRNLRVVIGKCEALPVNGGEPSMRKYLPFPLPPDTPFVKKYWISRFIY